MDTSRLHIVRLFLILFLFVVGSLPVHGQTTMATVEGEVADASGAVLPGVTITAVNKSTGFSRSAVTSDAGTFRIALLPVGEYTISAERDGFKRGVKTVRLQISQIAEVSFSLAVGEITEEVLVEAGQTLAEPTRTEVSSVINVRQIEDLPVNGRQFIDFVLLAPGVTIGDTTSGSTDVIVEPVTKLSFAGQNIHYNFIAVDGADNMSTASGIQKTTPSQDAVQEFRVINSTYSTEFGRAVGGIVNIITKSGTNEVHGSAYEFFRNDNLDANSILTIPGLRKLQQNQFGFSLGGPIVKDRTFFFGNYEGQRRRESPFYNSAVLANIDAINDAKVNLYGLKPETLNVNRVSNSDTFLAKVDHDLSDAHHLTVRYFFNDGRFTNQSPLNDGFDLPSTFRNNFFRDQSLVGNVTSTFSPTVVNELRIQFARRFFDFPVTTTQPHLEVANTFTFGVNRGNPDFYKETRFEVVDNVSLSRGNHTFKFGGNINFVRTTESFPLFYPFEADFGTVDDLLNGTPFVIFFQKFDFDAPSIDPAVFQGNGFAENIRNQAKGSLDRTYDGLFIQDKWRATTDLTLNFGVRYEFETWPNRAINNDLNNVDPRIGLAYNVSTDRSFVIRAGAGIFHGIIPSPLFMCQEAACGGSGPFPGRENIEDDVNARTRIFAFASIPPVIQQALGNLINDGLYPTIGTEFDFLAESVIVRFARNHQAPYGIQASLSLEAELLPDTLFRATVLHVKGVHLGSFFNVNQPDPSGVLESGRADFAAIRFDRFNAVPGVRDPNFAVYFEADSRWNSVYDGLLIDVNKRYSNHFSYGISYTFSKSIDDGPNPSFVLIPTNSQRFDLERALSADHATHRFVANWLVGGPTDLHPIVNNFQVGFILTLESPHFFTKFAGFDANGDIFGNNDRVGADGRNTFKGDSLQTLDMRVSRSFDLTEKVKMSLVAEAFNVFNTLNVRFFNTTYGDSIFNPPGTPGTFFQGARNPSFGTPRAIFNPRQIQFALRFTW